VGPDVPAPASESLDALRRHEGVRKGMARLGRRLARFALQHIEQPDDDDRTEDIHQVRVQCKRLRALLRLLKPVTDEGLIARENARLRDAARALSEFRDAYVAGETLKRVFEDSSPRRMRDAAVLLGVKRDRKPKGNLETALVDFARDVRQVMAELRKLPIAARGWAALAPGLQRSYQRARKSFQKCRKHGGGYHGDAFHEWRKHVKDMTYQLEFLDNLGPGDVKRQRKDFRRLGTLLGDDHDYVVFAAQVGEREKHYQHLASFQPVRKRLRRRLKELRAREFALAGPLFSDSPEEWIARLAACWMHWKNPEAASEIPVVPGKLVPESDASKLDLKNTAAPPVKLIKRQK
jgi:CHAD domain-containing protein